MFLENYYKLVLQTKLYHWYVFANLKVWFHTFLIKYFSRCLKTFYGIKNKSYKKIIFLKNLKYAVCIFNGVHKLSKQSNYIAHIENAKGAGKENHIKPNYCFYSSEIKPPWRWCDK